MKEKKIISLILSVVMLFSVVSAADVSVIAEDDILNYLTYEINDGEVTLTGCKRDDYGYGLIAGDVILPDTVNGYPVTSIGDGVFDGCDITSIIIPETVRTIGKYVFTMNYRLKNITIPKNVKAIDPTFVFESGVNNITVDEDNAYFSSDEYGVLFNKDKTELVKYPECLKLTEYCIPDSVKIVGEYAFQQCFIENISVPNSVTTISAHAFENCYYLESIQISNPDCFINDSQYTIWSDVLVTIYGYTNSTAEAYAEKYGCKFIALPEDSPSEEESSEINSETPSVEQESQENSSSESESSTEDTSSEITTEKPTAEHESSEESSSKGESSSDDIFDCSCKCHSENVFIRFIYKIISFFRNFLCDIIPLL